MPAARLLEKGDVLTLGTGAGAPTLQVESVTNAGVPTAHPAAHTPGAAPPPAQVPTAPVYQAPTYEPEPQGTAAPAPVADEGSDWMTSDSTPRSFYTPKRRKSSDAAVAFGVVATIAILAGSGVFIYVQRQKAPPKVVTVVQTAPTRTPTGPPPPPPRSMFTDKPAVTQPAPTPKGPPPPPDVTDELEKPKVTIKRPPAPAPNPEAPGPSVTEKEPPPVPDSAMSPEAQKAFKRVESTYWETDPAKCLLAIDAFQAEFPDVEKKKLEQYREDMLDKAWWLRVDSLLDKQNELKQAIEKTQKDIKIETEQAYRKTVLEPRLEDQKARLAKAEERLVKEMNYKETTPPPIGEEGKLQAFRAKRDKTIYDAWKARILKYVRDNHGSYPWATEK
jgi:hypothetical protein